MNSLTDGLMDRCVHGFGPKHWSVDGLMHGLLIGCLCNGLIDSWFYGFTLGSIDAVLGCLGHIERLIDA